MVSTPRVRRCCTMATEFFCWAASLLPLLPSLCRPCSVASLQSLSTYSSPGRSDFHLCLRFHCSSATFKASSASSRSPRWPSVKPHSSLLPRLLLALLSAQSVSSSAFLWVAPSATGWCTFFFDASSPSRPDGPGNGRRARILVSLFQ